MERLPPLPVAIPLIVAALLVVLERVPGKRRLLDALALATSLAVLVVDWLLLNRSLGETLVYWFGGWRPWNGFPLGIVFVIDPASAGLALLAAALTFLALLFSWHYFKAIGIFYHTLMLLFLAAMQGFCLTGDLFNMFVFFELMGVAAYALTGYKIEDTGPLEGGLNFAVMNSIGAFLLLFGIGIVYARTGGLNMAWVGRVMAEQGVDTALSAAFVLLTAGFLIKAAVVPFHFWLADAHAVAPTPASVLFSGIMVELGIYGVARLYWTMYSGNDGIPAGTLFLWLGSVTALGGAIMALLQRHLKRLLAFSTVSHSGMMLAGLGLLDPWALAGTLIYIAGHGFIKGALFVSTGIILHHAGAVDTEEARGRCRNLTGVALLYVVCILALAGMPPFGTSVGKRLIEHAAQERGLLWLGPLFITASALTAGAAARAGAVIFANWGKADLLSAAAPSARHESSESTGTARRTPTAAWLALALPVLAALAMGLLPRLEEEGNRAAQRFCDADAYRSLVLEGAIQSLPVPAAGPSLSYGSGLLSAALSAAVAATLLFSYRLPATVRSRLIPLTKPVLTLLRQLHSGYIGDYTAWFMVGAALMLAMVLAGH